MIKANDGEPSETRRGASDEPVARRMPSIMSALEILLLRHAQSQGNEEGRFGGHGPTPLTAHGRAQAELTAKALAREGGLTAILSSDLVRAVRTAHAVSQATSVDVVTTTELRERSVGIFTGLTFTEAETRH